MPDRQDHAEQGRLRSHSIRVGEADLHVDEHSDEHSGGHREGHSDGQSAAPDVVVLSGGPGCVHYLASPELAPIGFRSWFPEPRGVGRSTGGPHSMATAVADLEAIRIALGLGPWIVLGHSWGADLAVRYALDNPEAVHAVVAVAGRGAQRDRHWSAAYEAGRESESHFDIEFSADVHAALSESFTEWIHRPTLWRSLADSTVPMEFIAAGDDIRPSWPLAQLAALVPGARYSTVPGAVHNFWSTDPALWRRTVTEACARAGA